MSQNQHIVTQVMKSPEDTAELARFIGGGLDAGDVVLLTGQIGAGKTHFARALIQSRLPYPEDVPSPTFTIVQTYDADGCEIWHTDLYRLTSLDEVEELGLFDAFEEAIVLVEWPDRLEETAPKDALSINLSANDTQGERLISASWTDEKWTALMSKVFK